LGDALHAAKAHVPGYSVALQESITERAHLGAGHAQLALLLDEAQLWPWVLRLRVGTPLTAKWAPLQEDQGADAVSVIEAEPLDVEDQP
jgi:hypothetical protein